MFERKKALKAIGEKLQEVQMNLENNYKDQTIQALKEAQQVYEQYRSSGLLKEKDIAQIEAKLKEYDAMLQHYGHANVSEFLKERY